MPLNDLLAHLEARRLSRAAYRATLNRPLRSHWRLAEQIRGAAMSIPANIAEGYGQGTRPQFIRGLRLALGSARELAEHVPLAEDMELLDPEVAKAIAVATDHVIQLLVGVLRKLGASVPDK